MNFGFIGLGNMAAPIIKSIVSSGRFTSDSIYGYNRSPDKTMALKEACGLIPCESIPQLLDASDVVVLAVKPQMLPEVLPVLKKSDLIGKLVVTIAAGKELQYYTESLNEDVPVVRVMPNINANVGAAVTALVAADNVTAAQKETAIAMFEAGGFVMELPETLFSVFTAVGGSGTAFAYMFIDALARAAVKGGMTKSQAVRVAAGMVFGSAKLVLETGEHPWELIDRVCSPGGTTIDGVLTLQENGFESAVHKAVEAVIAKDKMLKQGK